MADNRTETVNPAGRLPGPGRQHKADIRLCSAELAARAWPQHYVAAALAVSQCRQWDCAHRSHACPHGAGGGSVSGGAGGTCSAISWPLAWAPGRGATVAEAAKWRCRSPARVSASSRNASKPTTRVTFCKGGAAYLSALSTSACVHARHCLLLHAWCRFHLMDERRDSAPVLRPSEENTCPGCQRIEPAKCSSRVSQ